MPETLRLDTMLVCPSGHHVKPYVGNREYEDRGVSTTTSEIEFPRRELVKVEAVCPVDGCGKRWWIAATDLRAA